MSVFKAGLTKGRMMRPLQPSSALMTQIIRLSVPGFALAAVCIGIGAGMSVANDIEAILAERKAAVSARASWEWSKEPAADEIAREAGYSIASATGRRTMASCHSLKPQFRAGCRDFVDHIQRQRLSDAAGSAH